jgi:hypothetical protein
MYRLHAGPVSVKFADGELRYLCVGRKEIVRRVYFGVRDDRWDTVMPELSDVRVQDSGNSFKISFKALCRNDISDYGWNGEITGTADGRIAFKMDGAANTDFTAGRLGMNILFGAGSLAGQQYELVAEDGKASPGVFPVNVTGPLLADFNSFKTLRYTTAQGMSVSTGMDTQCIGMEDQRNYGDTSYKAFSSIPYSYPAVTKGDRREQTFTLEVKNAVVEPAVGKTVRVTVGKPVSGAKVPKIVPPGPPTWSTFRTYNGDPGTYPHTAMLVMPFNPALHMPDDDTFMENIPTVLDWVKSIRSVAPKAEFRIDPIGFNSPYPRSGADPRNKGLFAAPWCARVVMYLALGGVKEAAFVPNTGFAADVLRQLSPYAGHRVLDAEIKASEPSPVDVLAVEGDNKTVVWLMNLTPEPQKVSLHGLGKPKRVHFKSIASTPDSPMKLPSLKLSPFEVLQVNVEY